MESVKMVVTMRVSSWLWEEDPGIVRDTMDEHAQNEAGSPVAFTGEEDVTHVLLHNGYTVERLYAFVEGDGV